MALSELTARSRARVFASILSLPLTYHPVPDGSSVPADAEPLPSRFFSSMTSPRKLSSIVTSSGSSAAWYCDSRGATERMFRQAVGANLDGVTAGSFLSSIAGAVIGSMIAREFFAHADPSAAGLEGPADPAQDSAMGEADNFDMGGGFDHV